MKRNTPLSLVAVLLIIGCNNGPTQEQYKQLEASKLHLEEELAQCKATVADLQNTPELRLAKALSFFDKKDYSSAEKGFKELLAKYPGTAEAANAEKLLAQIQDLQKKQQEEEYRKKTLGFKVLKEKNTVVSGDVTISVSAVSSAGSWTFDSYGDEYYYKAAERGNMFITAKASVTTRSKDPELPPLAVYRLTGGELKLVGKMDYRFARWKDYGSYLGNYADYGNDFAHTGTIRFSCGLEVPKAATANEPVFVVVKKENCFGRVEERFGQPPVSYVGGSCRLKESLTVDDFDSLYTVIKIFNRSKL